MFPSPFKFLVSYGMAVKSFELFEKAVTVINEKIKPDAVVITEDILNTGDDIDALSKGTGLVRKLKSPVIIAKGDHDVAKNAENKNAFESAFGPLKGMATVKGGVTAKAREASAASHGVPNDSIS